LLSINSFLSKTVEALQHTHNELLGLQQETKTLRKKINQFAKEHTPKRVKKRDPSKPKRAMSSYLYFAKEKRDDLMEEFPDLPFADIGRRLAQMWKALPTEEKKKYITMAQQDQIRYQKDMEKLY
jgi:hypothetical protein